MGNIESPFKHLKASLCLSWKFCAVQTVIRLSWHQQSWAWIKTVLTERWRSVAADWIMELWGSVHWPDSDSRDASASTLRQPLSVSALLFYSDAISRPSLQDERRASAVPSSLPWGTLGPRLLSRSVLFYLWHHFLCATALHKFYSERHKTGFMFSHRGQRLACAITSDGQ